MRKLLLVLELALVTWDLLLCAPTATIRIIRMVARRTATGALTTLWAVCLSVPARGSMASTVAVTGEVFMVGDSMDAALTADLALAGDVVSKDAVASEAAQ